MITGSTYLVFGMFRTVVRKEETFFTENAPKCILLFFANAEIVFEVNLKSRAIWACHDPCWIPSPGRAVSRLWDEPMIGRPRS